MSVGCWVQKKTPTPFERISLTVCSMRSRNAFEASENSRCASSKKNTSLGFSMSPASGSSSNSSASSHMRNVENSVGSACWSASSSSVTTPWPFSTRSRSDGSNSGSPKNFSPPRASRLTSARRITPAVDAETPPMPLSSALPSSDSRCPITERRSFMSSSASPCWSAQWKISPRVDSWVSLSPRTFDSRIGPNAVIVARTGTPMPPSPSDRKVTG
jgi:hypothetical protein